MVLIEVKEFHGFHGDLKSISKRVDAWPLSSTENMTTEKNGVKMAANRPRKLPKGKTVRYIGILCVVWNLLDIEKPFPVHSARVGK